MSRLFHSCLQQSKLLELYHSGVKVRGIIADTADICVYSRAAAYKIAQKHSMQHKCLRDRWQVKV